MTYGDRAAQTWKSVWGTAVAPRRLAMTRVTLTGPTRFGAAAYGPSPDEAASSAAHTPGVCPATLVMRT